MQLPLQWPVSPMLAKAVPEVPDPDAKGGPYAYEPKWDGFRCIVARDGDEVELGSRGEKPLTRYFPEVVEAVRRLLPERIVVDVELVVRAGERGAQRLDWEALAQRIHPAESRIKRLAVETPAEIVAFDLLAIDGESLLDRPFRERRARLGEGAGSSGRGRSRTPHAHHHRRRRGAPVVRDVRGRRPRRGGREASGRAVPAGQARDAQDQAPSHRGRGRVRLPGPQVRRGRRVSARRRVRRGGRGLAWPRSGCRRRAGAVAGRGES